MTQPPIEQQITFFYCRDLQTTAHFYEELLGLPLARDQGSCRIYRVSGAAYVGFCQREDLPQQPLEGDKPVVILTLVTPEVDAWYDLLRERGVVFDKAPAPNPRYGIYHCFLRDPNGYLIEIQRFKDPLQDTAEEV